MSTPKSDRMQSQQNKPGQQQQGGQKPGQQNQGGQKPGQAASDESHGRHSQR